MSKERFNSAAAWRVVDKKSERHPGYSGTANVDGVLYFVDVWVKKQSSGETYLSMSFKKRDKQEGALVLDKSDDIPL